MAASALISIKTGDDKIEIVNQLLLPHITEYVEIDTIQDAHDAIKTMKVGYRSMLADLINYTNCTDQRRASYRIPGFLGFCPIPFERTSPGTSARLLFFRRGTENPRPAPS